MLNYKVTPLGQVGFCLKLNQLIIYIDPYLSNSVQEKENSTFSRLLPVSISPDKIKNADYVLITHNHMDHCDEDSLLPIKIASKSCQFIGPNKVINKLKQLGFENKRLIRANNIIKLSNDITVYIIPSAHPIIEKDESSGWHTIGYVIKYKNLKIYHAGDTSLCDEVIEAVQQHGEIDIAMIPVNEQNYMREKQGIIGNMSVREAFYFAEQIGTTTLIPTHWDMFSANQVYKEEIKLIYNKLKPNFTLQFDSICC